MTIEQMFEDAIRELGRVGRSGRIKVANHLSGLWDDGQIEEGLAQLSELLEELEA